MKRMVWTRRNEIVFVVGVDADAWSAVVLTSNNYYMKVPLSELKLMTEDYNKIFAE